MFIIIGIMLTGMLFGYLLRSKRLTWIHKIITFLIWVLLFLAVHSSTTWVEKSHNAFIAIRTVQCSQVNAREQEFLDFFRVVLRHFLFNQVSYASLNICIAQMCIILRQSGIVLVGQ